MIARRLALLAAAIFLAYVVGRAIGILLGIGPWPTTVFAVALVIVLAVRRLDRERS